MHHSPLQLLFLLLLIALLFIFVQYSAISLAFDKLGLSPHSALLLFLISLFGSFLNLPLFSIKTQAGPPRVFSMTHGFLLGIRPRFSGRTVVTINVGGCLVPLGFCIYLYLHRSLDPLSVGLGVLIVSTVSYFVSRPVGGIGIGMPMFVAPVTAVLVALFLDEEQRAALAYISGVMGVLIGSDLLHFRDIARMAVPVASIGGAGTFDGIFLTGLVAVLLA